MKLVFFSIKLLSFLLTFTEAVYYKFPKFENCSSSDKSVIDVETCEASLRTGVNFTINVKKPLQKVLVIQKAQLNSTLILFCIWFNRSTLTFTRRKTALFSYATKHRSLIGVNLFLRRKAFLTIQCMQ